LKQRVRRLEVALASYTADGPDDPNDAFAITRKKGGVRLTLQGSLHQSLTSIPTSSTRNICLTLLLELTLQPSDRIQFGLTFDFVIVIVIMIDPFSGMITKHFLHSCLQPDLTNIVDLESILELETETHVVEFVALFMRLPIAQVSCRLHCADPIQ